MANENFICKGCKYWEKMCSKLHPIERWYNQDRCKKIVEGKYEKYKNGNGYIEDKDDIQRDK